MGVITLDRKIKPTRSSLRLNKTLVVPRFQPLWDGIHSIVTPLEAGQVVSSGNTNVLRDLSGNGIDGTIKVGNSVTASRFGPVVEFIDLLPGNGGEINYGNLPLFQFSYLKRWSWYVLFKQDITGDNRVVISKWAGGTQYIVRSTNADPYGLQLFQNGSVRATTTAELVIGNWYGIYGTCDGAGNYSYYVRGLDDDIRSFDTFNVSADGSLAGTVIAGGRTGGADDALVGQIGAVYMWLDRELSVSSVDAIHADPFGLIRPARRHVWKAPAAAAGTGQLLQIPHHLRGGFNRMHGGMSA